MDPELKQKILDEYHMTNLTTLELALKYDVDREDVLAVLAEEWPEEEEALD